MVSPLEIVSANWTLDDTGIDLSKAKYEGIVHGTHTLKINDFQSDDSGRYRCIAATAMGTGQSQERQFTCILTSGPMVEIQYMYFHEQHIPASHFLCITDSSLSFAVYIRFLSVTVLYEQQIVASNCFCMNNIFFCINNRF
jgi:hypothetical protein